MTSEEIFKEYPSLRGIRTAVEEVLSTLSDSVFSRRIFFLRLDDKLYETQIMYSIFYTEELLNIIEVPKGDGIYDIKTINKEFMEYIKPEFYIEEDNLGVRLKGHLEYFGCNYDMIDIISSMFIIHDEDIGNAEKWTCDIRYLKNGSKLQER